jgi:hypothetical protein
MCPYAIGANMLSLISSHPSQSYSNQSEFNFKVLKITFALLIQNIQNNKYEHCLVNTFSMISNAKSRAHNYKWDKQEGLQNRFQSS